MSTLELLGKARALLAAGEVNQAAAVYDKVARSTFSVEALEFLATYSLRSGHPLPAIPLIEGALQGAPGHPSLMENLGICYQLTGHHSDARQVLESVLRTQPDFYVSRLFLGLALRRMGYDADALTACRAAISAAQRTGAWLDEASTPDWLRDTVEDSAGYIKRAEFEHLSAVLEPIVAQYGEEAMARVRSFVASYTGIDRRLPEDKRQAPKTHYFPGLPAEPWINTAYLPWKQQLEDNFKVVRDELTSLLRQGGHFTPFLNFTREDQVEHYLGTNGPPPRWDAFFFYRHGKRQSENCALCPETSRLLEQLPIMRLPGLGPEVCFSMLTPGTRILPHRGDSNMRIVTHLPLIVPSSSCGLKVADETRNWSEGRLLAFDDTYEHEAWNESDTTRVVLIVDAWNPHLTEAERAGITAMMQAVREQFSGE